MATSARQGSERVTRTELVEALVAEPPDPGDVVYVERRGDQYSWRSIAPVAASDFAVGADAHPDVWIYSSGPRPTGDPEQVASFVDDLLAEMESMMGGDRCRWPLDEPWPDRH